MTAKMNGHFPMELEDLVFAQNAIARTYIDHRRIEVGHEWAEVFVEGMVLREEDFEMRVCIPAETDEGLQSKLYDHFGSAPYFLIYDTKKDALDVIDNTNKNHLHGRCHPVSVIADHKIDAVLGRGIGLRALSKLKETGIKVYKSESTTFKDVLAEYHRNKWKEITIDETCLNHICRPQGKKQYE